MLALAWRAWGKPWKAFRSPGLLAWIQTMNIWIQDRGSTHSTKAARAYACARARACVCVCVCVCVCEHACACACARMSVWWQNTYVWLSTTEQIKIYTLNNFVYVWFTNNAGLLVNNELGSRQQDVLVTQFHVLRWHWPEEPEENHERAFRLSGLLARI